MRIRMVITVLALLASPTLADESGSPTWIDTVRPKFEEAASELAFVDYYSFILGRDSTVRLPGDGAARYARCLAELPLRRLPSERSPEDLLPLLDHPDPKVRTLVLMALFAQEEPRLLPRIAPEIHDTSTTFPQAETNISYEETKWGRFADPILHPRTVSEVVGRMIGFYTGRSRVGLRRKPKYFEKSFAEYHEPRAKRGDCAGWWAVRLDRCIGGTSPIHEREAARIGILLHELEESLPSVDQELTTLYVFTGWDVLTVVDERRLVRTARRLGPDRLMDVLEGKPPTDDPDIRPVPGGWDRYDDMCAFVLRHARELLRPFDVERLLANPRRTRMPHYAIAAAGLAPDRAQEVLHEAFDSFAESHPHPWRAMVVAEIARAPEREEIELIVDWVCREQGATGPSIVFEPLLDRFSESDRRVLAAIVRDERFDGLNEQAVTVLARGLDESLLGRRFPERQFSDDWRRRIRESLPDWAPAD